MTKTAHKPLRVEEYSGCFMVGEFEICQNGYEDDKAIANLIAGNRDIYNKCLKAGANYRQIKEIKKILDS